MRKWLSIIVFLICAISFNQSVLAQSTEYAFKGDVKAFSVTGAAGNTYVWKLTHPDNTVETLLSTTSSSGNITFATSGAYILWVQATDAFGCLSEPISKTIVVTSEVTVTASIPNASETPGNPGQFTIDLGAVNTTGADITITYTISGTATSGVDYASLPLVVIIPNGSQTAVINVGGIVDDALVEANETVIITLTGSDQVLFPITAKPELATATVIIADNDSPVIPTVNPLTTNDTTPVVTGTATVGPNETLTVTVNGITYTAGDGNLAVSGTSWSLQIPDGNSLPENIYSVTATVTSASGLSSTDITANELTIDTTAPAPVPTVNELTTNDKTPILTGTANAGSGEILTVNVNGVTYTAGDGHLTLTGTNWSLQIPAGNEIPDGTYSVTATVTDAAGNSTSDFTSDELVIDTVPPVIPTVDSQITNSHTPFITGTANVHIGETLKVTVNGVTYTMGDGNLVFKGVSWSLQIPVGNEIPDGVYPVTATVTDAAGNSSTDSSTGELTIDSIAPVIPTVVSQTTDDATPIITGTAILASGETLSVIVNGKTYTLGDGQLTINGSAWSLQIPDQNLLPDGVYEVTATVTDAAGNFSTDITTNELTISTNKPPVAIDDVFSTSGPAISGNMAANDSDPEGGLLIYRTTPVTAPTKGDLVINADGTFVYTPKSTASGTDEFVYEVCDNGSPSKCSRAKVIINFNNQAPLAVNDNYSAEQGTVINGRMNLNDSDPDGNLLVYSTSPLISPAHGTVIIHADGTFDYTPETDFVGDDSFTYQVCDNGIPSKCSTAIVSLQLTKNVPVNHSPVAVNDINNTLINLPVSGNVLTNDYDPDGNELLLATTPVAGSSFGKVVILANGNYTYTPNAGFVGEDNFTYSVCDKNTDPVLCSEATVTIEVGNIIAGNRAPVANEDEAVVESGKSVIIHVLANDFDPDSNPIHISRIPTSVSHGTLVQNADGTFTYTPTDGFTGTDQFVYEICDDQVPSLCSRSTVTIQVQPKTTINQPPFAADDAFFTAGEKISGNLSLNDMDPEGNNLIYATTPVIAPTKGTVTILANGQFEYTPNSTFAGGSDQFVYQVCDDGIPSACSKATVYITLLRKTTPRIIDRIATNDVNVTFRNTPVSGNVLTNDAGFFGNNPTVSLYLAPLNGAVSMASDGKYTYSPKNDFIGTDNFYYTVCTAEDPADCDTVNVTVQVITDVLSQVPPVANDDELQTYLNNSVNGNVLANDFAPSGESLILNTKPKDGPKSGSLILKEDGSFVYTPNSGFTGQDYFVYEGCGAVSGICSEAKATITVTADPLFGHLFAADDLYFSSGKTVNGNMLANDSYPSGTTLSVNRTPVISPVDGTLTINSNGTFNYAPTSGFIGTDQFVYEICDTEINTCSRATVYIIVKEAPALFADLSIQKTGPANTATGETISYQITVTNLGTAVASQIQISDYLQSAIQNPKFNLAGSAILSDWSGYYELNTLDVNKSFSLTISGTVAPNAPDTLKNRATVTSLSWDPVAANNISVVNTLVRRGPVARILGAPYLAVGSCNTAGKVLDASKSGGIGLTFSWSPSTYLSNSAIANPVFVPGKTTRYHLTITDSQGQKDTASVLVIVPNAPTAVTTANVFVKAPNETIMLDGSKSTGAGLSYLWLSHEGIILNGETTPTAQVSGLGMYYLQVTDSLGCMGRDSVNVGLYIQAINDTATTKVNESVIINVVKNDIPQKSINPSSISIITPPLHGIAQVSADSLILYQPEQSYIGQDEFVYAICDYFKQCDQAKVLVLINDVPFFIPEAFSPNGDGINDKFEIKGLYKYKSVQIEIFNRWGNIVYESKNYGDGKNRDGFWDGTAKFGLRIGSGPVPTGTYFYILKLDGTQSINGSIYLDR